MATRVSRQRQVAAVFAFVALAVLAVAVVVILFRHGGELVLGLAGLAVAAAGAWWAATERRARRAIGAAGVVAGFLLIVASLALAVGEADRVVARAVAVVALLGVTTGCARAALVRDLHRMDVARRPGRPPQHPVLLCNPWSGGGKVGRFGLVELAGSLGVETVLLDHGLDLEQLARDAVARGADCLGMAGGDGSQALVASIAVEHGLPFVCVSAGTRNHFALDLGLNRDDPRESLHAFGDAVERRVDYATVGDRLFVNNVSLGIYAAVVQSEGYRQEKAATTRALLPELLGRQAEPFDLQFVTPGGEAVDGAFVVQVSNNPYVIGASLDNAQRRRLDTGLLGVVAISSRTGADTAELLTRAAIGRRRRSPNWHEFTTGEFEVRSRSGVAYAGVDGEALELPTPLRFRIHPGGLRLLVPEGNREVAERRRARNVDLRALLAVAAGREPAPDELTWGHAGEGQPV